ncbi:subtype B tannase [Flavobacterium sp. LM4]|uniref:subtype B tannase n=1 Tax=Flavobacterium sp. LM4 TaxID=1938609 RepID=UPI000993E02B|nr:subtype B tannase [Flavobacterium sp. LM4]OOV20459.1 alpha/beta hydrolase [Flavobacterium sp. LM4]
MMLLSKTPKALTVVLLFFSGLANTAVAQQKFDLTFNTKKFSKQSYTINGTTLTIRAYENIVYVKNPVDTTYQKMNIYIPEDYFEGKKINGYTATTAPLFFPNKVGGYMPAKPATVKQSPMGGMPPLNGQVPPATGNKKPEGMPPMGMDPNKPSTVLEALAKGYVVASAGARGRTNKDDKGIFYGKAPAGLVDLKAAIRYLKFNDKLMIGDAKKIISNGTSAGGAMSSLLGATGNNPDYEPYLKALGAAEATDDVFAVSAYCPITNLDHADMAYEWQFFGYNTYKKGGPFGGGNAAAQTLTDQQIKVSTDLKSQFPTYLNALKLKDSSGNLLSLDENGNGNFKDLVKRYVINSAQKALNEGTDMSPFTFLNIVDKKVTQIDFEGYLNYLERQKTPPAFDALDLSSPETMVFGDATTNNKHFTDYSIQNSSVPNIQKADEIIIKMMNPMNYIGNKSTTNAKHWRIRHGAKDKDTSLAISVILATALQNNGINTNLELPWGKPHSGDYDLIELFQWIDGICK